MAFLLSRIEKVRFRISEGRGYSDRKMKKVDLKMQFAQASGYLGVIRLAIALNPLSKAPPRGLIGRRIRLHAESCRAILWRDPCHVTDPTYLFCFILGESNPSPNSGKTKNHEGSH